jgi:nucleoside 2-deoxyribosyltransferase
MKSVKLYLAGPINGCSDSECKDWRSAVKALHPNCLDPMSRDYRGKEADSVVDIVEGDKRDIDECDVVVVFFEKPSVGTSMEVLYAWERKKRVVVVNRSGKPVSPWLVYHSDRVVESLEDAVQFAKTTPTEDVKPARKVKVSLTPCVVDRGNSGVGFSVNRLVGATAVFVGGKRFPVGYKLTEEEGDQLSRQEGVEVTISS